MQDELKSGYSSIVSCVSSSEFVENHFEFVFDRYQSSDLILLQQRISSNFGDFSDYMLCREILWMFMGLKGLNYFLISDVYLPSTQFLNPLFTLLSRLCCLSNKLLELRDYCRFVQNVTLQNSRYSKCPFHSKNPSTAIDPHSTITFQAFSSVLLLFLHDIDSKLIELEKEQLFRSSSVIELYCNLLILSGKISYFYEIFLKSVYPPNERIDCSPIYRVCWLLDSLWSELTLCDLQYTVVPKFSSLTISAFLITLAPLFAFISQWFFEGRYYDECQEFFIQQVDFPMKCDKISSFWENGCKLRSTENMSYIPNFLIDLAPKILLAGKSLGCYAEIVNEENLGTTVYCKSQRVNSLQRESKSQQTL